MTAIDYRNGVAIALLIFYIPALAIAAVLTIRHGFGKAAGWRLLAVFTLVRVLSSCFQIATISHPTNKSLYTGALILLNIAVSPLELTALGLLHRITASINKSKRTLITTKHLSSVGLLITIGLVLTIIGGIDAGNDYSKTGHYTPQVTSKAGLGLWIASFAFIVAATVHTAFHISYAEPGEKRILFALVASLPLILVRLVYSSISTFTHSSRFNSIDGDVTIQLCMALLEEVIIVVIYEGVGITLTRVKKHTSPINDDGMQETGIETRYTRVAGSNQH
ncbi:MAG: hypothetical protein M1827_001972 [Pycnora praestabilis]|nr:MAG: hypothetical protein M1827_001972 [Pycnora praestabilis]